MKRTRIRKQSPEAKTWRELDKMARLLVVILRDNNTCQRCGSHREHSQIHWAHIINRNAKSVQWTPWNSLALCAGCHLWFDGDKRKEARDGWWASKWPDRAQALAVWRTSRAKPVDLGLTRAWLKQEIAKHVGLVP